MFHPELSTGENGKKNKRLNTTDIYIFFCVVPLKFLYLCSIYFSPQAEQIIFGSVVKEAQGSGKGAVPLEEEYK